MKRIGICGDLNPRRCHQRRRLPKRQLAGLADCRLEEVIPPVPNSPPQFPTADGSLRFSKQFSAVLGCERLNFLDECGLLFFVQLRRWRRTRGDLYSDLCEESLLSRGRADTEHADRPSGSVLKLMRSVGRNGQGVASAHGRLLPAEGCFHLPFEQDEGLFEVMPMRRRPATWRDVHIHYAEASICL